MVTAPPNVAALTWRRRSYDHICPTQVTFLYIYGHMRVHVCAELEDRRTDKLSLAQHVCFTVLVIVHDIHSFGA